MNTKNLCILIENAFIDQLDKVALLGAVQELEQYRKNPLATMGPCWKYVEKNGIKEQLDKITLEIAEVGTARGLRDISQEVVDVLQGAITLAYILATKFGVDLAEEIAINQTKNVNRGYFDHG